MLGLPLHTSQCRAGSVQRTFSQSAADAAMAVVACLRGQLIFRRLVRSCHERQTCHGAMNIMQHADRIAKDAGISLHHCL